MRTRRLADRKKDVDGCRGAGEEDVSPDLVRTLQELLDRLTGARDGGTGAGAEEVARWEGEGYLYYETALAGTPDAEIDLNITGGRAFIRTMR